MNITKINDPHLPMYNIRIISQLTNLQPVTLRAWERRYGLPLPSRGEQGYRLYSEYDLHTIHWLKMQVSNGLTISRAAEYLGELRTSGKDPIDNLFSSSIYNLQTDELAHKLFILLSKMDADEAIQLLENSRSRLPLEQVFDDIIRPAMVQIGDAWHKGEIPIAVEHHATQLVMHHLHSWINQAPSPHHQDLIVAACAPKEQHQIGLLMLILVLRVRGWDVRYFGADLNMDGIGYALNLLQPRLILLSSTQAESAKMVQSLLAEINNMSEPRPLVVLGGQGFINAPALDYLPSAIINLPLYQAVLKIEEYLLPLP